MAHETLWWGKKEDSRLLNHRFTVGASAVVSHSKQINTFIKATINPDPLWLLTSERILKNVIHGRIRQLFAFIKFYWSTVIDRFWTSSMVDFAPWWQSQVQRLTYLGCSFSGSKSPLHLEIWSQDDGVGSTGAVKNWGLRKGTWNVGSMPSDGTVRSKSWHTSPSLSSPHSP